MNKNFKQSRAIAVLAMIGGTALVACAPAQECVEAPVGLVVSDFASGKVEADPLPRCKTDWARLIDNVAMDSEVDQAGQVEVVSSPTNPLPGEDEISSADTSRANGDGDGENRESGASIPTGQNMGASSSSRSATQSTEAVAQSGANVSASAIDNGEGVSISRNPNGGFSVSFSSTDD
jgi:hypothetical protein